MLGPASRRFGYGTSWAIGAILAGLLVILAVTGYFFNQSISHEQEGSLAESEAIARSVAAFVQAKEQDYLSNLQAYAGRFRFREAVQRRDRPEALVHLRQLQEFFPEMDAAFLVDPEGVLWARFPETRGTAVSAERGAPTCQTSSSARQPRNPPSCWPCQCETSKER